jgi:ABC-2 type transport system permease protein
MTIRRIATIFRKDLRDAIRDARVLVALFVPLSFGLFYNFTFDDDNGPQDANVVYQAAGETELPDALTTVVDDTVDLHFMRVDTAEELRDEVQGDHADIGLIIPAGFDDAVRRGEQPELQVIYPPTTNFSADYVTAALEPALRMMAGQPPPATLTVEAVAEPEESETAIDTLGIRTWSVLVSVVLMIGMIAMLAIPVILAEETEKKTLDALVMIASYREVVIAKAALGVFYIAVMIPLLFILTQRLPERVPLFTITTVVLGITLIGFGLLLAGLFNNANQLNTWSGLILMPVLGPAFAIGLPVPDAIERIAELTPTGAGMKLLMNSAVDQRIFSGEVASMIIIAIWGVAAYVLLLWQLSRRQA